MTLTPSLKIKISLSVVWFILVFLLSLVFSSESYSSNKLIVFISSMLILHLPIILYWLGVWIWGEGYLWGFIKSPFVKTSFPKKMSSDSQNYPWRRLMARIVDYWWWGMLLISILTLIWPALSDNVVFNNQVFLTLLIVFSFIFVEAVLLALLGTTPIKWMLGIRVIDAESHNKLTLKQAYERSAKVWTSGLCIGLPILNLVTMYSSYKKLKADKTTTWDLTSTSMVYIKKPNWLGISLLILFVTSFFYLIIKNEVDTKNIRAFNNLSYRAQEQRGEIILNILDELKTKVGNEFQLSNLQDKRTFKTKRRLLNQTDVNLDEMYKNLEDTYTALEISASARNLPQYYADEFDALYYPHKQKFLKNSADFVKIEKSAIEVYRLVLDFLEGTDYEIRNDQIYFEYDFEVEHYKHLITALQKIAEKEKAAIDRMFD